MQPLFDLELLQTYKASFKVPFKCQECGGTFYSKVSYVKVTVDRPGSRLRFCSTRCFHNSKHGTKTLSCTNCGKQITRNLGSLKKVKNPFCSRTCSGIYNNTHKEKGNRRSKLELWLEQKLTVNFPNLYIKYNCKDDIQSELDIYIPSLKLAVELNGIYHYEPIHGYEKLASIQNNDDRKFQACLERGIEFMIIDTTGLKYFKEGNAIQYYTVIEEIILKKLKGGCHFNNECFSNGGGI